jgi:hypothetical protein
MNLLCMKKSIFLIPTFLFLMFTATFAQGNLCTSCDSLVGSIKYTYNKENQRIMISVVAYVEKWRFRGHFYSSLALADGKIIAQKEGWNDCDTFSLCQGGYDVSTLAKGTQVFLKVWGIKSDNRVCKQGYNLYIPEADFAHSVVIE